MFLASQKLGLHPTGNNIEGYFQNNTLICIAFHYSREKDKFSQTNELLSSCSGKSTFLVELTNILVVFWVVSTSHIPT